MSDINFAEKQTRKNRYHNLLKVLLVVVIVSIVAGLGFLLLRGVYGSELVEQGAETQVERSVNTNSFEGVWRPVSIEGGNKTQTISKADMFVASVRGYGNGLLFKSDGSGQCILLTDDVFDEVKQEFDASSNFNRMSIEEYIENASVFDWSRVNETEAVMTYDKFLVNASALADEDLEDETQATVLLQDGQLVLQFPNGVSVTYEKESDDANTLALLKITSEQTDGIKEKWSLFEDMFANTRVTYTLQSMIEACGIEPMIVEDNQLALWSDDKRLWCAVALFDEEGQFLHRSLWLDRTGRYNDRNISEAQKDADEPSTVAVDSLVSDKNKDTGSAHKAMSYDLLDKLLFEQKLHSSMTLEDAEKIAGKSIDLGTRHKRDAEGNETDEMLYGHAWHAEKDGWQVQMWFNENGERATTDITGDFDMSKSEELAGAASSSESSDT